MIDATNNNTITHFRGRMSSGAWIYGDLMHYADGECAIMPTNGWRAYGYEASDCWRREKVDKETVGQFIGWYDREGTPLYVGDQVYHPLNDNIMTICAERGSFVFKTNHDTFYPYHLNRDGLNLQVESYGYNGENNPSKKNDEMFKHKVSYILSGCLRHTKLYSPLLGDCYLESVDNKSIKVRFNDKYTYIFNLDGELDCADGQGECMLFPSRWDRDWNNVCAECGGLKFINDDDA